MIRDDAKIIVTPTGISLKEALTKEVVKALNEEALKYINYDIPEVKLGGNPPSGKENLVISTTAQTAMSLTMS